MAIAFNPEASSKEFDTALREVRGVKKDREEVEKAREEHRLALENAWRNEAPLSLDTVWDEWEAKRYAQQPNADANAIKSYIALLVHKAIMRFHMTGNSSPLLGALKALQSPEALASLNLESIARLRELLDARRRPLKVGRPRGRLNRWRSARYIAAHLVEEVKAVWRSEHNQDKVPAAVTEEIADNVVKFMKSWDATKRRKWLRDKPLTRERVLTLLHESKWKRG